MSELVVVAEGGLVNLKEALRGLERAGVEGRVLPPAGGCRNG